MIGSAKRSKSLVSVAGLALPDGIGRYTGIGGSTPGHRPAPSPDAALTIAIIPARMGSGRVFQLATTRAKSGGISAGL
jgi:hypothetical protein